MLGSRSRSCLMYQLVFNKLKLTTRTSRRTPSTSCKNHSGKVSLSPLVNRMEPSSQLVSMLCA